MSAAEAAAAVVVVAVAAVVVVVAAVVVVVAAAAAAVVVSQSPGVVEGRGRAEGRVADQGDQDWEKRQASENSAKQECVDVSAIKKYSMQSNCLHKVTLSSISVPLHYIKYSAFALEHLKYYAIINILQLSVKLFITVHHDKIYIYDDCILMTMCVCVCVFFI